MNAFEHGFFDELTKIAKIIDMTLGPDGYYSYGGSYRGGRTRRRKAAPFAGTSGGGKPSSNSVNKFFTKHRGKLIAGGLGLLGITHYLANRKPSKSDDKSDD